MERSWSGPECRSGIDPERIRNNCGSSEAETRGRPAGRKYHISVTTERHMVYNPRVILQRKSTTTPIVMDSPVATRTASQRTPSGHALATVAHRKASLRSRNRARAGRAVPHGAQRLSQRGSGRRHRPGGLSEGRTRICRAGRRHQQPQLAGADCPQYLPGSLASRVSSPRRSLGRRRPGGPGYRGDPDPLGNPRSSPTPLPTISKPSCGSCPHAGAPPSSSWMWRAGATRKPPRPWTWHRAACVRRCTGPARPSINVWPRPLMAS